MNWKQQHIKCPCGKSSDAYSISTNGWGKCFSCGENFPPNTDFKKENNIEMELIDSQDFRWYAHRGISEDTFKYFEVQTKFDSETPVEVGFKYPNSALKIRSLVEKKFTSLGPMKDAHLFGSNLFDPAACHTITITEGEYDAISIYEVMRRETACVSVRSSSSAFADCKAEWDYINSFKKIVLCFDNDEQGQKAARQVASLFDFNKVFKVDFVRHKDANDYLQAGEYDELRKVWLSSKRYTPDNIISTFEEINRSLIQSKEDVCGTYPFGKLQNLLYGLHRGELIVMKGNEGIGKTEVFKAIEHHLLKTQLDSKLGILHLEEDNGTTVKALATYEDKYPYVHPESSASNEDVMKAFKACVSGKEDRVYIYESFDVEDENQLLDNIRFLVSACGCTHILLDHITWLATGLDNEDERRKLDRISQKLKLLAKELRFCLIIISHTNDEGKTRGSRNITKVANTVIHLSRDITALAEQERNKLYFMIEKARTGGNTGPAGYAVFERETMRLIEPQLDLELKL